MTVVTTEQFCTVPLIYETELQFLTQRHSTKLLSSNYCGLYEVVDILFHTKIDQSTHRYDWYFKNKDGDVLLYSTMNELIIINTPVYILGM